MPRDIDEEPPSQRRRFNDDEDEENDSELPSTTTPSSTRASRLEALAAKRRQRQQDLQQEVLQLAGDSSSAPPTDSFHTNGRDNNADENIGGNDDGDEDDDDFNEVSPGRRDEEEDDGEDLMENAERDYQRIAALDTYGAEGLDDTEFDPMDRDMRVAADREIARRTQTRQNTLYGRMWEEERDEDEEARLARRGMFDRRSGGGGGGGDGGGGNDDDEGDTDNDDDDDDNLDGDDLVNLEAFDVPLREWIAQDRTRREIQRRFRAFLRHFIPSATSDGDSRRRRRGNGIYEQTIKTMCAANKNTLEISYTHLVDSETLLAYWLADAPRDMLQILNEAATRYTVSIFPLYVANAIAREIHVRIKDVPLADTLRELRRHHLDGLVKVPGVITRRSAVYPVLQQAYYLCGSCQLTQGPFATSDDGMSTTSNGDNGGADLHRPDQCPRCEGTFLKLHPTRSIYRNVQRLYLQETPGSVPPGRVPRSKEVIVTDDLIDIARPGEEIEVTGIYQHSFDTNLTVKSGFPVFSTWIYANHINQRGSSDSAASATNLSEEDIRQILELSRDPRIAERIVQSIAPSIYGQDFPKTALAMSLFGGVAKTGGSNGNNQHHRIRGDVNVLLLGDPGTAKSQLLKYAQHTAPRAIYSTGKGASAVGLTASVHKDPITREWTLEGGALVLADQGVCLIDEFDKMNEQDRTSIHEAMEQQSISISKAGIVTSLQARCAVIAAANPIGGRYDSSNTLSDNVELTDPILQRFDILCVLQDVVDPVADERLAKFVTSSHMRSVPTSEWIAPAIGDDRTDTNQQGPEDSGRPELIPQALLRKYIQYARTHVRPVLRGNAFDQEKVMSLYAALRRESTASGGVPIAVRHVESMMRMAEAHAKMHLRDHVRDDDMDASIRMMLGSFIDAQKFSVRRALQRSFSKFLTTGEDRAHLLLHILQEMFRNEQMYQVLRRRQRNLPEEEDVQVLEVPLDEFEGRARERRIYDVTLFCKSSAFTEAGYTFDERRGMIYRSAV